MWAALDRTGVCNFATLAIVASFVLGPSLQATELAVPTGCGIAQVSFDGVAPLMYMSVVPRTGDRSYLHREYPSDCHEENTSQCRENTYLIKGDQVAVGATCGAWSYVQFLAHEKVSEGWVASGTLLGCRRSHGLLERRMGTKPDTLRNSRRDVECQSARHISND